MSDERMLFTAWAPALGEALAAPFPADEIEFLPRAPSGGRALAMPYIDARAVMRRLDWAVGGQGWSFDFDVVCYEPKRVMVKGKLTVLGVTKCDAGEAGSEDEPLKSAVSDAIKRCGVHFGIARYLYALPAIWAPFDPAKRRFTEAPRISAGAIERALALCDYRGHVPPAATGTARSQESGEDYAAYMPQNAPPRPRESESAAWREGQQDGPERAPARPGADLELICAEPGCALDLTPSQAQISNRHFGMSLCPAHQKTRREATSHGGE